MEAALRGRPRLTPDELDDLCRRLEASGLHAEGTEASSQRLDELRATYEPYAVTIATQLRLELPELASARGRHWVLAAGLAAPRAAFLNRRGSAFIALSGEEDDGAGRAGRRDGARRDRQPMVASISQQHAACVRQSQLHGAVPAGGERESR